MVNPIPRLPRLSEDPTLREQWKPIESQDPLQVTAFNKRVEELQSNIDALWDAFEDSYSEEITRILENTGSNGKPDAATVFSQAKTTYEYRKENIQLMFKMNRDLQEAISSAPYVIDNLPSKGDLDNYFNAIISPKITNQNSVGLAAIFGQSEEMMTANRKVHHPRPSVRTEVIRSNRKFEQEVLQEIENQYLDMQREGFPTTIIKNAYMDLNFIQQAKKRQWQKNNPKSTNEPTSKQLSEINISDLDTLTVPNGITFQKTPTGEFKLDPRLVITKSKFDESGQLIKTTSSPPRISDMMEAYIKLITAMQAEGTTEFTCTAKNKKILKAFRDAAAICGIPADKVTLLHRNPQKNKTEPMKSEVSPKKTNKLIREHNQDIIDSARERQEETREKILAPSNPDVNEENESKQSSIGLSSPGN